MAGQHDHQEGSGAEPGHDTEHPDRQHGPLTRRRLLAGGLAGGAALALGGAVLSSRGGGPAPVHHSALTGSTLLAAGMHVHASYSEREGSWESQYAVAAALGVHVLWQTDHDFRARGEDYMTLLRGKFTPSVTGTPAQQAATFAPGGVVRVMVEAADAKVATQALDMAADVNAVNNFRTGIDGQSLTLAFGAARLDPGALFEVVITLSRHPAQGSRPGGVYSLRYRFRSGAPRGRFTEGGGLVGVVLAPLPAEGATVTVTPVDDIAALWPDMLAIDHASQAVGFAVTSPGRGSVADVSLESVRIDRTRHDAEGVLAAQRKMAATWAAKYRVAGFVAEEVSLPSDQIAHCNVFGAPPEFALKAGVTADNWHDWYRAYIERQHSRGGLVSWNHPYGPDVGPVLSSADQVTRRRQVLADLLAHDLLGADLLEVGYDLRGYMPMEQHVALWDTLSRRARFLTGNGVSDDHSGRPWQSLQNGHLTGIWAASSAERDLVGALQAGRAFAFHPRNTPGLELDTLVDDAVPMGQASVSAKTSRRVAVHLAHLPADAQVELVIGPVDHQGEDPGTSVVSTWPASAFGTSGSGTVTFDVDTSADCFVRPQVRTSGVLTATGNPTWLLHRPPPGGIPLARQA